VSLNTVADLLFVPEWPRMPLLTDADARVTMEMTSDGRVRWRLEGSDVGGWLRTE
jgi:hypothetical protein